MAPLAKRLPRELRRNIGKYLGIFLLMCGSIALTSGFLLAAHSIGCLIDDMRDAYAIEDGRVTTSFEATDDQLKAAEDAAGDVGGVTLYKNFSIDAIIKKTAGDDGTKRTLRTYAHRAKVDIASYCEGKEPKADDEVAIDRVFATNNNLSVGDKVELEGRTYTICGIMTQPDSQALFLNNSDFTVNTITYGVAEVTDGGFAALEDAGGAPAYTYSFTFTDRDLPTADRIDAEQDMVEALTDADARVDDLTDADSNQGIGYARDDVDGDSMMWMTLLDIIIVIMAFVFVVLTDATIEEESVIIGTLLASGYRRREIVLHYLALPAIVGVVAALLGTALGVVFFTEPMRSLYYGSPPPPPAPAASAVPTSSVTITPAASAPQASRGLTPPAFPGEWHERWHRLAPKIVVDKPRRPQEQMDVDVQWSREVAAGERPATIRFWQWASPAVVVGRFQSIPDEVHEDVAAKEGFTVVRRCTGGGAMFIEPGNTITYSLYAPRWFAADLDIEESYRLCDMWLIAALRGLGLDVGFSGLNDIASSHGKIGGAAQRRFPPIGSGPGSILHHVTLAYDIDAVKMTRVLNISGEKMSDKAVKSAVKRVDPMRAQTGLSRDGLIARLADCLTQPDGPGAN